MQQVNYMCLCGFTLYLFVCLSTRSASTRMCNLIQKCVCVCVCVQLVGCVGQLLMMLSGSLLSHEMIQTRGLTGWPTFTGTGNWNTAGHTHKNTKYIYRVPVTLQHFALRNTNISQVQRAKVTGDTKKADESETASLKNHLIHSVVLTLLTHKVTKDPVHLNLYF